MTKAVMLDSGPLGRLTHADYSRNREIRSWLAALLDRDVAVFLPEIADYEVRRNLIVENLTGSLANLDALPSLVTYVPITTADMRQAATLWAKSRKTGRSVADPKELSADVILAAQATRLGAIIATDNIGPPWPVRRSPPVGHDQTMRPPRRQFIEDNALNVQYLDV